MKKVESHTLTHEQETALCRRPHLHLHLRFTGSTSQSIAEVPGFLGIAKVGGCPELMIHV